jgi:aspartyl protease family protein
MNRTPRFALCIWLALTCLPAIAQKVALTGVMGQRALLVIDDAAPVVVGPGETRDGVTVISAQGEQAVVQIQGHQQTLRVGEMPVSVTSKASSAAASRVVLSAGPGGHFISSGQINGAPVQFLVDTGASVVSLSAQEADRIGLRYRSGRPVLVATANGQAVGYAIQLNSVRLGEVEIYNVEAIGRRGILTRRTPTRASCVKTPAACHDPGGRPLSKSSSSTAPSPSTAAPASAPARTYAMLDCRT